MIAASGCGCAPDSVVRWVVFGVLVAGGLAIWVAGRRRARRGDPTGRDPSTGAGGGTPRGWATRAPNIAAAVMLTLAAVVAIVEPDADVSLAVLAVGAVVASAGMGIRPGRRAGRTPSGTTER